MKFFCVTACFNAESEIRNTMQSVLSQTVLHDSGHRIHYRVQDGGSRDRTLEIAHETAASVRAENLSIEIVSAPDGGLYDALATAFDCDQARAADWCSYINAGDYYSPAAFDVVECLAVEHSVRFLTGAACLYNQRNHLVKYTSPFGYSSDLIGCGMYGTRLPYIQQESTFWHSSLMKAIDLQELRKLRLAGDFYLWKRLSDLAPLVAVDVHLAGFKLHEGQLSSKHKDAYAAEFALIATKPTSKTRLKALLHKRLWKLPSKYFKYFSPNLIKYDLGRQKYRRYSR